MSKGNWSSAAAILRAPVIAANSSPARRPHLAVSNQVSSLVGFSRSVPASGFDGHHSASERRKIVSMTPPLPSRRRSKAPPPGQTGQEALYLRSLSDRQITVQVKLRDGETVRGWIEYFDDGMLRLTREGKPNLFIYKHQIRSITEVGKGQRRAPRSGAANGIADGEAHQG